MILRLVAWFLNKTEPTNGTRWKAEGGKLWIGEIASGKWWLASKRSK